MCCVVADGAVASLGSGPCSSPGRRSQIPFEDKVRETKVGLERSRVGL